MIELRTLAKVTYEANRRMNVAKAVEDKSRKELYLKMKQLGISALDGTAEALDGSEVKIHAKFTRTDRNAVDTEKLKKLVSVEQFMDMATVTQGAVVSKVGTSVLNQVLIVKEGEEFVSVKSVK